MLFGYNTNGFAHHRLEDALEILAELGYQSAAITLDYHVLYPFAGDTAWIKATKTIRRLLEKLQLRSVIETGARFVLDPRHKHQPTLISPDRQERHQRLEFLEYALDTAAALGSAALSFWSGTPTDRVPRRVLMDRLVEGCQSLCEDAARLNVRLAFEPEPGMFIDTMPRFAQLFRRVDHPQFGLTLDIGHLHCQGEVPIAAHLRRWRNRLWNVHIEDMRRGVHDHLMFGEGEIDFAPVLRTLAEIDYAGGVHVELSRHSHNAVETARRALAFLRGVTARRGGCPILSLLAAVRAFIVERMSDVSQILEAIDQGDPQAAHQLLPLVYKELRRLAAHKLAQEPPGQTLDATALVHEAYLRLVGTLDRRRWESRGRFFAAASEAMRRILVDKARRKRSGKRGGRRVRQDVDESQIVAPAVSDDLLAVDEALNGLTEADPQAAELVKLRYFAGLSIPDAAQALGISPRTADRLWVYARAWLHEAPSRGVTLCPL